MKIKSYIKIGKFIFYTTKFGCGVDFAWLFLNLKSDDRYLLNIKKDEDIAHD